MMPYFYDANITPGSGGAGIPESSSQLCDGPITHTADAEQILLGGWIWCADCGERRRVLMARMGLRSWSSHSP